MISSVHNAKVQQVRSLLRQAHSRREQGAFVVEGVRLGEEVLQSGWKARLVMFTAQLDQRGRRVVDRFAKTGVPAELVSDAVMDSLSETETPQGLLVVLEQQSVSFPPATDFLLVLDEIRDPGNLGTMLRTSAAAGVQAVILSPGCADVYSPKVLRSAMGAHFRLPLLSLEWSEITRKLSSQAPTRIFLADSAGGIDYTHADFRNPLALIIGGEASGAGEQAESLADEKVHIPMPGKSESLNAAVAAGILLFEIVRQRASERINQDMLK